MSTGRVRIYDLSRELNLENRDILAVCDQLAIAAKSHSSTITESEAAQIRTAARQQFATAASSEAAVPPATPPQPSPTRPEPRPRSSSSMPKKQQILEIRSSQGRSGSPTPPQPPQPPRDRPTAVGNGTANRSDNAPRPPQPKRPQAAGDDAVAPPRPVKPVIKADEAKSDAKSDAKTENVTPPTPAAAAPPRVIPKPSRPQPPAARPPAQQNAEAAPTPPAPAETPAPAAADADPQRAEPVTPPKLIRPPARPAAPTPKKRIAAPVTTGSGDGPTPNAGPKSSAGPSRAGRPTRPTPANGNAVAPPSKPPKPTIVELRRPKPVRPAESEPEPEEASAALLEKPARPTVNAPGSSPEGEGGDYESKLKRPVTRPSRRPRSWEKEEEEESATASKTAKEKARAKRRQIALEEDEDEVDFDAAQAGMPAPTQVSMSIARPPKPKSATAAKPSPQQVRGPVSRPRRQTSRDRRERVSDNRPQRPEILTVSEEMTVGELAKGLVVPETEIIKKLFLKGVAVNINQTLDIPTIEMVAEEFDVLVETAEKEAEARKVTEMLDAHDLENLQRRPPVVTIMGHVDHGKTTLLDSIRKTKVAQGEAGGITQHIGAYHVDIDREGVTQQIVFLDTPGHEAFTAMRARGTRVTDIAILVVAADDGVRPQTIEAISHARAAEVPIVVAINKMDKEGAQPDRVKQELSEQGLVPEEWGGDTIMVPVSAIRGENLDTLLEMLVLVSEVEELSANPDRPAKGTVIEAHLDRARGPVASLLVQNGTLRVGDVVLAGPVVGKVRAMIGDRGDRVEAATPSFAVEVLGFNEVPAAGDEFDVFASEREAKALASDRGDLQRQSRLQQAMSSRRVSLTGLSDRVQEGELKELNLVIKADVQGSVEAILGSLQQLPQNEVQVRVLLSAAGEVTETDVDLAAASDAVIIGFNTTLAPGARKAADDAGVDVREYAVIYKLLDEIQAAMEGLLDPIEVEEPLGQAEVRAVFSVGRGAVAGCYIQNGKLVRDCRVRVHRGKQVVYDGRLNSLRRVKDDVKEVNSGYECGVGIDSFATWEEGDIIEAFKMVAQRRTLTLA